MRPPAAVFAPRDPAASIDAFVREKQRERGFKFFPEASREKLLRRASFDLTGLPPTPDSLRDFLSDRQSGAWERALDRLLDSPHYGERWARWWLDLARYADTNGQDENKVMASAWRYRDWVIRSFQANIPIDEFLQAQIAGDLMPTNGLSLEAVFDRWTATGFLVLGPKMLAEQDKPKLALDIVDEQIETVGRAYLGLTVSCARCHDHKYDPIPTRDYYSLAGVFKSTRTMENFDFVSKFNERWTAPPETVQQWKEYRVNADASQKEIDALIKKANDALGKPLPDKPREKYPPETLEQLRILEEKRDVLKKSAPLEPPQVLAVQEAAITNLPVLVRGNPLQPQPESVPRGFLRCASPPGETPAIPDGSSGRLELARWLTQPDHPLTGRVFVNRVWQALFADGLVHSSDNFGLRGDAPSHPELLDWLTQDFIRSGWNLKRLLRTVMLSRTYRQDSVPPNSKTLAQKSRTFPSKARAVELARDNPWLAGFPRKRLEGEMVRDAMLSISGLLDPARGGTLVEWKNNEYVPRDEVSTRSRRRSIYLPVVRDRVFDMFSIFDCANPSVGTSKRVPTVVSHQALYFLNSPSVLECAAHLASRLRQSQKDDPSRVSMAFQLILGRHGTRAEIDRGVDFLRRINGRAPEERPYPAETDPGLAAFCHTLFASNEFLYLD